MFDLSNLVKVLVFGKQKVFHFWFICKLTIVQIIMNKFINLLHSCLFLIFFIIKFIHYSNSIKLFLLSNPTLVNKNIFETCYKCLDLSYIIRNYHTFTMIVGNYVLTEEIGIGAFSTVYRAHLTNNQNQLYAIKSIKNIAGIVKYF